MSSLELALLRQEGKWENERGLWDPVSKLLALNTSPWGIYSPKPEDATGDIFEGGRLLMSGWMHPFPKCLPELQCIMGVASILSFSKLKKQHSFFIGPVTGFPLGSTPEATGFPDTAEHRALMLTAPEKLLTGPSFQKQLAFLNLVAQACNSSLLGRLKQGN